MGKDRQAVVGKRPFLMTLHLVTHTAFWVPPPPHISALKMVERSCPPPHLPIPYLSTNQAKAKGSVIAVSSTLQSVFLSKVVLKTRSP